METKTLSTGSRRQSRCGHTMYARVSAQKGRKQSRKPPVTISRILATRIWRLKRRLCGSRGTWAARDLARPLARDVKEVVGTLRKDVVGLLGEGRCLLRHVAWLGKGGCLLRSVAGLRESDCLFTQVA